VAPVAHRSLGLSTVVGWYGLREFQIGEKGGKEETGSGGEAARGSGTKGRGPCVISASARVRFGSNESVTRLKPYRICLRVPRSLHITNIYTHTHELVVRVPRKLCECSRPSCPAGSKNTDRLTTTSTMESWGRSDPAVKRTRSGTRFR
jgi:hypothetical protein